MSAAAVSGSVYLVCVARGHFQDHSMRACAVLLLEQPSFTLRDGRAPKWSGVAYGITQPGSYFIEGYDLCKCNKDSRLRHAGDFSLVRGLLVLPTGRLIS